jgi:hypothetical protein
MSGKFQVTGRNNVAPFTLKVHRGDGMALLAMNWRVGTPPDDFVGFAIQYKEPGGDKFFALKNLLNFLDAAGRVSKKPTTTMLSRSRCSAGCISLAIRISPATTPTG